MVEKIPENRDKLLLLGGHLAVHVYYLESLASTGGF